MKNKRVPVAMITGYINTFQHSNTVLTITDESERDIPVVNSDNYTVIQPIYSPKGVTNEWILIEGSDIVNRYVELFGSPHTAKYGPMATIAYNAVLGQFNLAVINMRPAEATYPNLYLAFNIEKAKEEDGVTPLTKMFYGVLDSATGEYFFSFNKEEVEEFKAEEDTIVEIPLEYYTFGYENYTVEDLLNETEVEDYFVNELPRLTVAASANIDDIQVHVPQIMLAYRGAGDYGNSYKFRVTTNSDLLQDAYPSFQGTIKDSINDKYSFSFAMFDTSVGNLNYGFEDRATNACQQSMSSTNVVQEFRAWSIKRKEANKAEKPIQQVIENAKNYIIAKVKEKFPTFDETVDAHNLDEFTGALDQLAGMFKRNRDTAAGAGRETPFSFVNPWLTPEKDFTDKLLFEYHAAPTELQFASGTMGQLREKLDDEDFSWDTTLTRTVADPDTGLPVEEEYKVWEDLLIKAYSGELDDSIFDPTIVPDGIMFGEQYPVAVQEQMDTLCKYKEDVLNVETVRPDFCYIRTPQEKVNTISKALDWSDGFLNGDKKNINMHPLIGSWRFTDQTTGAQERFSGCFDWLGDGSILFDYLFSCTHKAFATGDYSIITKGATNSQMLIPRTSTEREELKKREIMYFKRRSTGMYALGEDTGYIINKDSVLKNIGSNIQFNRIMNIAHNIMRDNVIIDPTTDDLESLKRKIESAIVNPAQHFKDKVSITIGLSTNSQEVDRNVVLCEIRITGNDYSRYNRLHMIAQRDTSADSSSS